MNSFILNHALAGWTADRLSIPDREAKGTVASVPVQLGSDLQGRVGVQGTLKQLTIGRARTFREVLFHLPNFPDFGGLPIRRRKRLWRGRLQLEANDWLVELDERANYSSLLQGLRQTGGSAITHVGRLSKGGSKFSRSDAKAVFESLHWFLSFVRGAWSSPMLINGSSAAGSGSWSYLNAGRTDGWGGNHRWCDWTNWDAAKEAFAGYATLWQQPTWESALRQAIGQYITANKPNPVESAIIAAQSGLELLGWMYFVDSRRVSPSDWRDSRKYRADRKIRELLTLCKADIRIPSRLRSLGGLDPNWKDGPSVVAGVRNQLVHPATRSGGGARIPGPVLVDTWLLISRYLELVLLHAMGVQTAVRDRLGKSQWTGATANPPWAP